MDAATTLREEEKNRLLQRLAEIMVSEQRELGTFRGTPHFSTLEQAGRTLGQQLSVASLKRAVAEVAAASERTAACPHCGQQQRVEIEKRAVHGIDGSVELLEPRAHCPACRRDFFPSA